MRDEMHPTTQGLKEKTSPPQVQERNARAKLRYTYSFNRNSDSAMQDVMKIAE